MGGLIVSAFAIHQINEHRHLRLLHLISARLSLIMLTLTPINKELRQKVKISLKHSNSEPHTVINLHLLNIHIVLGELLQLLLPYGVLVVFVEDEGTVYQEVYCL